MKTKLIALLAMASMLLAGCHKIDSGVVVGKHISPPSTTYGKSGNIMLPVTCGETYKVVLRNGNITESFCVRKEVYYSVEIGDTLKVEGVILR